MADQNVAQEAQPAPKKFAPQWAAAKKPPEWKLAAAFAANRWEPEFPALTEEEFDAAIKAAGQIRIG